MRITRYLTIEVGHIHPGTSAGKTALGNFIGNTKSIDRELCMGEALCKTISCVGNSSLKGIVGGNFYRNAFIGFIITPLNITPLESSSLAQRLAEVRKVCPLYAPYVK